MSKAVHNNSTIECQSAEVISRKILPSSFVQLRDIKCFTYKCSRNSESTIIKKLRKGVPYFNKYSLLDVGSKLECDLLFVAVETNKPYKLAKINHSGRHKAQTFTTKDFTFAKISRQLHNIPLLNPPKKIVEIKNSDN